jgi:hypothetical protein
MSAMDAEQRQKFASELVKMKYNQAKWKLLRMDPEGRIRFYRNTQRVGYLMTSFELPTYNVRATLYEIHSSTTDPLTSKISGDNKLAEVIVEPLDESKMTKELVP